MLKILQNLGCGIKKQHRKLTNTESPGERNDDTLDQSIVIPIKEEDEEEEVIKTSPLMSKVLGDVSLDVALLQNRATPIDFCTKEVKTDNDVMSEEGLNRNSNFVTPSPVPEETEEFIKDCVERDRIFEPSSSVIQKLERESDHVNESSPSASSSSNTDDSHRIDTIRARMTKYMGSDKRSKDRLTPILGGSLRPLKTKRHSVAFDANRKFCTLDRPNRVRLRKRGDASRRDAVEAGFEPREAVPRCHSTQSLREVQRVKAYSNSQFQASDLSLDPNGRVLAECDSTSGTAIAPVTAVVNPAQTNRHIHHVNHRHRQNHHHQHNLSYDGQLNPEMVDRRRSLQTLTGATSLYQMTNGGGRSQFSPSELASSTAQVHQHNHIGSRVRVASVNQLFESTSTPQFSIDQRRSVHNIVGTNNVRNSFAEGVKITSTPKNQIAVAPLAHNKSRHLSESRDEMRTERRGSSGNNGHINLPAYQKYMMAHNVEERLVDGPITNANEARIAYLEKKLRELEMKEQHSLQSTPNQSRHSKSSHYVNGNLSTSEQLRLQEMQDELMSKERKMASLESKLLKAYQRIERLNDEHDGKIKHLMYDGERARDDLTRCVDKIRQLEDELSSVTHNGGDHSNEQEYVELRDKMWKQERELQESRSLLAKLREKEAEFERMRSEKGYLEQKNDHLNKKLEAKKRAVEELERSVSTMRLEHTVCQQSCSSGSTPLADELETMSDIRPSLARPYTKAHSTLGSHMSPLSHSKSSGLTKSFSNFALNSSKRDDVTPMMSRTIRKQDRHITMCRAMVVCLKDTVERLARGENPDVARLLGVKLNVMSESEMDDDDDDYEADESKPFSMMSAESALTKQCAKMAELDKDLDTIRCQLADWHGQTSMEGEGDREVCRVQ